MMTMKEQQQLAANLRLVVDFCLQHGRGSSLQGVQRDTLVRYVAFCHMTGKMAVSHASGEIDAVAFYWPDWLEKVEAKDAEKREQFEWAASRPGDCLFIGDVIGNMKGVSKLYTQAVERWPHLAIVPLVTYRHGKLHRFNKRTLERILQ